jgi:hypothetical protein
MLEIAGDALDAGRHTLDILAAERTWPQKVIAEGEFIDCSNAREYADALLGQVFVKGSAERIAPRHSLQCPHEASAAWAASGADALFPMRPLPSRREM